MKPLTRLKVADNAIKGGHGTPPQMRNSLEAEGFESHPSPFIILHSAFCILHYTFCIIHCFRLTATSAPNTSNPLTINSS